MTKREAQEAEAEFLIKSQNEASVSSLTFSQLINLFIENRSTIVKETTMYGYKNKRPYLDPIANVKLKDFNIEVYERWRRYINSCNISTRYKNDIYKFLKSLLNYATDWYGFSFVHVYRKMHNFNNPNELPKEMLYFTYDEFQKFLSVEKDIKFRCAWQLLYYCGLRIGELKGITWKDINLTYTADDAAVTGGSAVGTGTISWTVTTPANFETYVNITKSGTWTITDLYADKTFPLNKATLGLSYKAEPTNYTQWKEMRDALNGKTITVEFEVTYNYN